MAHALTEAKMIKHSGMGLKAQADVPERIAPRQLPEKQMQEMVIAVQVLGVPITFVPLYYLIELVTWDKLHNLGKYKLALIHNPDAFGKQQD